MKKDSVVSQRRQIFPLFRRERHVTFCLIILVTATLLSSSRAFAQFDSCMPLQLMPVYSYPVWPPNGSAYLEYEVVAYDSGTVGTIVAMWISVDGQSYEATIDNESHSGYLVYNLSELPNPIVHTVYAQALVQTEFPGTGYIITTALDSRMDPPPTDPDPY